MLATEAGGTRPYVITATSEAADADYKRAAAGHGHMSLVVTRKVKYIQRPAP